METNNIAFLAFVILSYVVGYLHAKFRIQKEFVRELENITTQLNKRLPPDKQVRIDIEYEKRRKNNE